MSDKSHTFKAPRAIVEQIDAGKGVVAAPDADWRDAANRSAQRASQAPDAPDSEVVPDDHKGFQQATVGFFDRLGRTIWAYADAHPHAVLYGLAGFVLAVLILVIGLWDTIVITVFVFVGTVIGEMVDGDSAAVNAIRRFFDGRH